MVNETRSVGSPLGLLDDSGHTVGGDGELIVDRLVEAQVGALSDHTGDVQGPAGRRDRPV